MNRIEATRERASRLLDALSRLEDSLKEAQIEAYPFDALDLDPSSDPGDDNRSIATTLAAVESDLKAAIKYVRRRWQTHNRTVEGI